MTGIYIHVPFCKQACTYCNFYFVVNPAQKELYLEGLQLQIEQQKGFFEKNQISSIYLGGGTPSMLNAKELQQVLEQLPINNKMEVTLEVNPDDVSSEAIYVWKSLGINRISLGVQSLHQTHLNWMNRAHNSQQAQKALFLIAKNFDNFSLDIMYGLPNQSMQQLQDDLQAVISYNPSHISAYALTIEERTPLFYKLKKNRIQSLNDDLVATHFEHVSDFLQSNGFEHYEISNFAKEGARAVHNSNYWNFTPYLGLGPGAHGFDGKSRYANVSSIQQYLKLLRRGEMPISIEPFDPINYYNELLIMRLRTKDGIDLRSFKQNVDSKLQSYFFESIQTKLSPCNYMLTDHHFRLLKDAWTISDSIIASLMFIRE